MKNKSYYTLVLFVIFGIVLNSCNQSLNEKNKSMEHSFSHHVFFWLNNPDNQDDRATFEKGIQELLQIPEIKSYHLGVPASVEEREVVDGSYTYSYLVFFENQEGHDIYQDHPLHHKFIDDCKHLWSKVLVYDSVME